MTSPEPDDRRSFASRTPVNDNPEKVVYRRGFVTRHQVTGWRFVMRRIASGVALHDTRMLVDPLRTQTRAVLMGVIVLVTATGRLLRVLADPAERLGGQQSDPGRPVDGGAVRAGGRSTASGAQPGLGPADRRQAGQPHPGEKQLSWTSFRSAT